MITIIIPLRLSKTSLYDEVERLHRISNSIPRNFFSVLIVDYGTGEDRLGELNDFSSSHPDVIMVRGGDPNSAFSIGEARDIGVLAAKTSVIMFHDLDFLCETETYKDIASEVALRNYDKQGYDFLCIPTIFLSSKGTLKYLSVHNQSNRREADRFIHNEALRNIKNEHIQHTAIGSSALIVNRYFYLISGGHDRSFTGHGAEDFEFYNRLTDLAQRAGRPPEFRNNVSFDLGRWEGFRSFYSLYGMDLWMRGVCLVHLNHPRREKIDESYKKSSDNFEILRVRLKEFTKTKKHLAPFGDPQVNTKTLVLADPNSLAANSLRNALPSLGEYVILKEQLFDSPQLLTQFLEEECYNAVVFLNPFGNEHRLKLYREATQKGFKCFTHDRGALTDSWFFDDGGFLGDSTSYDERLWNIPLDRDTEDKTKKWMVKYFQEGITLEENGKRNTADFWQRELGGLGRKIVFVALQRPSDTATRFFSGPAGSYTNFLDWIRELSRRLDPRRYLIVVKKHPLENSVPDLGNVKYAPNDAHVHDLLDACDKLIVLNSGTGVLAISMNKPVIVCGNAFYAKGNLAYQANDIEELVELAHSELITNEQENVRFIHYLKDDFYSFGKSSYIDKAESEGSRIRLCNKIEFSVIRGLTEKEIILGEVPKLIEPGSFLFRGVTKTDPNLHQRARIKIKKNTINYPSETYAFDKELKLGCEFYHKGNFTSSVQHLENALDIKPDNANLRRIIAEALYQLGRRNEAIINLTKACQIIPDNRAISRRLKHLRHPLLRPITGAKPFPVPTGK